MTASTIIEGLLLVQKLKSKTESDFFISAEHDEIFVGIHLCNMPKDDIQRMKELGWIANTSLDGWRAQL